MGCEEAKMLLDAFVDGELSAEQEEALMAHVHACEACALEYEAAAAMRDCLKDMEEEAVPLEAQAAWRKAVHAEAKRKLTRRWTRIAAVAAAALVLVVGVGLLTDLQPPQQMELSNAAVLTAAAPDALIAADGAVKAASMETDSADAGYTARRKYCAGDVQAACRTVEMLAAEYSGSFELLGGEEAPLCRVELPCDYMEDFLSAVGHIGTELDSESGDAEGGTAIIYIQINAE